MIDEPQRPEPPGIGAMLALVIKGIMLAIVPGILLSISVHSGTKFAISIVVFFLVIALMQGAVEFLLIRLPAWIFRGLIRLFTGRPAPARPVEQTKAPQQPRHWQERAAFWSPFFLTILLFIWMGQNTSEGAA